MATHEEVLAIVSESGDKLMSHGEFSDDPTIVIPAAKQSVDALLWASARLRSDRTVMLAAVKAHGRAIRYTPTLRDDFEIALEAVKNDGDALQMVGSLRKNKDIVLAAVTQHGFALAYADDSLRGDVDVVVAAIQNEKGALNCAAVEAQSHPRVLAALNPSPAWTFSIVSNPPSNFAPKPDNHTCQVLLTKTTVDYRKVATTLSTNLTPSPALAVDIGSAYGNTAAALAKHLPSPKHVLGIDVGWKFVEEARKSYPEIQFERLDVLEDAEFVKQLIADKRGDISCPLWVFVDIGGVRELAALVRLLPFIHQLHPQFLVVKSKRLVSCAASRDMEEFWPSVLAIEKAEGITGGSKERRGGAAISRYPLKLPVRFNDQGVEICRFHNYSPSGCIRGETGQCSFDHATCHWCSEPGHVALGCEHFLEAGDDSEPLEAVHSDGRLQPKLSTPAPFLVIVGGRLRGKTLVNCERLKLSAEKEERKWEICPSLGDHRGSLAASTLNNRIYAVGGGGMRANHSSCEYLDDATRTWRSAPSMKNPRHAAETTVLGGSIYAVGGWTHGSTCLDSVERLEEGKNCWVDCKGMIQSRRLHGVASLGGKVYVFGGSLTETKKTATAEVYNVEKNEWTFVAPLPRPMICVAMAVGKFIYIFCNGDDPVLRYEAEKDKYVEIGNLPIANWHCFAVAHDENIDKFIYLVGGTEDGKHIGKGYRVDVLAKQDGLVWEALPELEMPRRRTAIVLAMLT